MLKRDRQRYQKVYQRLIESYGPQHWWPAESPFEVMIGAILTQNTNWSNVERALDNLKARSDLDARKILEHEHEVLAEYLKPSGYFNVKAVRLTTFCAWYIEQGGLDALKVRPTDQLRSELLAIKGIGPETADDILLYAFERPVFVIDAYTRRIFSRLGLVSEAQSYEQLRALFEEALGPDVDLYNEYHALIVRHGKMHCRPAPKCSACPLKRHCRYDEN
jgi:endonuclease-3 related protein